MMCCDNYCLQHDDTNDTDDYLYTMNLMISDNRFFLSVFLCLTFEMIADIESRNIPGNREKTGSLERKVRHKDLKQKDIGGNVGKRDKKCKVVPEDILWQRLGPYVDESRMSRNDPNLHLRSKSKRNRKQLRRSSSKEGSDVWPHDRDSGLVEDAVVDSMRRRLLSHSRHNSTHFPRGSHSNRAQRRFKQKRQKSRNARPWQCELHEYTLKMKDGFFPPFIKTGKCAKEKRKRDTCMLGMFECRPKKYSIKVLKKVPNECTPVPSIGSETVYEEAWHFVTVNVRVACECSGKKTNKELDFPDLEELMSDLFF